jgi:hypothetical protein
MSHIARTVALHVVRIGRRCRRNSLPDSTVNSTSIGRLARHSKASRTRSNLS